MPQSGPLQKPRPWSRSGAGVAPGSDADEDQFFIPDLCAPQAVFLAVLLAELVVLLHVLALGPLASFDWRALATGSLFVQWNTLSCLALICALRSRLHGFGAPAATAICIALVVAVCELFSFIVYRFYPVPLLDVGTFGDWMLRNAIIALLLAAIVLRYSYLQQRVAIQQRSALQLRLDALTSRIRPHFLFNTLNSIASLIAVQPDRAEQAIEDVAELFRAALQADERDITLRRECRLCELYLDLETLRLGDRLQIQWDLDQQLQSNPLPPLLLQPLVENAVYHGIAQRPEGGTIRIHSWREGKTLCIEVENPMPDSTPVPAGSGQRMALDNIRQRLDAQYGTAGALRVGADAGVYRARISLPLELRP